MPVVLCLPAVAVWVMAGLHATGLRTALPDLLDRAPVATQGLLLLLLPFAAAVMATTRYVRDGRRTGSRDRRFLAMAAVGAVLVAVTTAAAFLRIP
ncbi:MAG: hypothetical protein OER21_11345 [Gemmatimonadota bacterium]|nr:hypothetical protein [Gemmatimonadota bacterium]